MTRQEDVIINMESTREYNVKIVEDNAEVGEDDVEVLVDTSKKEEWFERKLVFKEVKSVGVFQI